MTKVTPRTSKAIWIAVFLHRMEADESVQTEPLVCAGWPNHARLHRGVSHDAAWPSADRNHRFWISSDHFDDRGDHAVECVVGSGCGPSLLGPDGFGYLLWAFSQAGWPYYEVLYGKTVPDPWSMDIFLFLHLVPMIAAVGLRPHRSDGELKFRVGTLDFLLLMVWWIFLYAFVVFPSQYVSVNVAEYDRNFGALYLVESGVLVLVLGGVARGAPRGWKEIYLNLMAASALYAIASEVVN